MTGNHIGNGLHTGDRRLLWIKVFGMFGHIFHEGTGESLAEFGGVVHLADTVLNCFGNLVVRDTGGAMQHQRNVYT